MSAESAVLKVQLLRPEARLPLRATPGSSGLDLFACLEYPGYLELGRDVVLVPTGIAIETPAGYDAQIRPRSGLAARGVNVMLGTIDSDYRGELFVSMHTIGSRRSYNIQTGDRIAQLVISRLADGLEVVQAETLVASERGHGGHGSTGR